jgi:HSP20 family molecular chaperone IbpA
MAHQDDLLRSMFKGHKGDRAAESIHRATLSQQFDQFAGDDYERGSSEPWRVVRDADDELLLETPIPGFDKKSVHVEVDFENFLHLTGSRRVQEVSEFTHKGEELDDGQVAREPDATPGDDMMPPANWGSGSNRACHAFAGSWCQIHRKYRLPRGLNVQKMRIESSGPSLLFHIPKHRSD